jgi:putative hydrolase of the HAD superfamily
MSEEFQIKPPSVDWQDFDTILLDMDGTVLDLAFDNYFWRQLVPAIYASQRGISVVQASEVIYSLYASRQGTLEWYCMEFWSEQLDLDLRLLKHSSRDRIRLLPGAAQFLDAVRRENKRLVLVTNAHPDALEIKRDQTGLNQWFDEYVSSHEYGIPKERQDFWHRLQAQLKFDAPKTLFVDDSLAVLDAARTFGLGGVVAIRKPGSGIPTRDFNDHHAIDGVNSWVS